MLAQIKKMITASGGPQASATSATPTISIVVIVYDMPRQAERTLYSLSAEYQQGVTESDYEVIVVENESRSNLDAAFVAGLPSNFTYHLRAEREPTPVHAVNHGAGIGRGRYLCIMIDGARMVTPGVVRNLLRGHRLHEHAVVTVPGYHIGDQLQQDAVDHGYGEGEDQALIDACGWPQSGYNLFDIACFSGSCSGGFYLPVSESNCISIPRHVWAGIGGMDTRFNIRGGGMVNLDLYRRACEFRGIEHVVLQGEGTFHQFHGGVTTGGESRQKRDALMAEMDRQYEHIRGERYRSPVTAPVYLGELSPQVLRFVQASTESLLAEQASASTPEEGPLGAAQG